MLPSLTPVTQIEPKGFNQALTLNVLATVWLTEADYTKQRPTQSQMTP